MEQTRVMSEETWSSLSGMYTTKEDSEIMTQLLRGFSCPNELSGIWSSDQETRSLVYSPDFCNSTECIVSQEIATLSPDDGQSILYPEGTIFHSDNFTDGYMRPQVIPWMSVFSDNQIERFGFAGGSGMYLFPASNRECLLNSLEDPMDKNDLSDIARHEKQELEMNQRLQCDLPNVPESKKRSRSVTYVGRSKRNLKSEKYQKVVVSDNLTKNNDGKSDITKRISASHSTGELSNITQEATKEQTQCVKTSQTPGGKGKSRKGASSDPQSLYARKRRERINERLRILQGLVPNGTKVDISTMLEEAVHYVNFLQLQIKLLSSDDTWMYAPLAYNGMDIGIRNFDTTPSTTSPR